MRFTEWAYGNYSALATDLDKHIYMWRLHDNNSLFYALIQRHLLEMLPVVYDPTVGEAIENFSEIWTRPRERNAALNASSSSVGALVKTTTAVLVSSPKALSEISGQSVSALMSSIRSRLANAVRGSMMTTS